MHYQSSLHPLILLCAVWLAGCGTNRFEKEVEIENAAVKLASETVIGGYDLIPTVELKKVLDSEQDILLIDAMPTKESYNKGHIPGAVNFAFPKEVMHEWKDEVMDGRKREDFERLLGEEKGRKIIVYCGFVKCARSHNAAICAQELGYTNVFRYPGGIHAWRGAGNPLSAD